MCSIARTLGKVRVPKWSRKMILQYNGISQIADEWISKEDVFEIRVGTRKPVTSNPTPTSPSTTTPPAVVSSLRIPYDIPVLKRKRVKSPTLLPSTYPDDRAIVVIGCSRVDQMRRSVLSVLALKGVKKYSLYLSLGCPEKVNAEVRVYPSTNRSNPVVCCLCHWKGIVRFQKGENH